MNKICKLAIFSVWLLTGQAFAAQKVALVIGNSQYQQGKPLANPVNDAIDIEARFKQLGYSTILLKNATHQQMLAGLERFKQQLNGSDVGVFYYAGHGVELKRYNYLVPVDATMDNELSIKYQTLQLDDVANVLNSSGVKSALIVLDACRDNPFKAFSRSESRGLQRMNRDIVGDLKIIYAAQEGQVAKDGNGRNGVFTSEFLRYMGEPLSYPFFFDKVKQGVIAKSGGEQRPSEQGEISPNFSFVPVNDMQNADKLFWDEIKNSTDTNDYQAYLNKYPNGQFVELARNRQLKYGTKPALVMHNPTPVQVAQVQVREKPQATTNNSDEELMKKGMWRDPKTNLVWMRCSLGQTWDGTTCTGEAKKYTWQQALDAAKTFNNNGGFGGYNDWQVPHIEDLSTIRYCSTGFKDTETIPTKAGGKKMISYRCKKGDNFQQPTINRSVFPNTRSDSYWSSSPVAHLSNFEWFAHFGDGDVHGGSMGSSTYVRLVRSNQNDPF